VPIQPADANVEPNDAPPSARAQSLPPIRAWPAGIAVLVGVTLLALSIGLGFLAAFGVGLGLGANLHNPNPTDLGWSLSIATLVQQASLAALVWIVAGWRGSDRPHVLALNPPAHGWRSYATSFLALVCAAAVMSATIYAIDPTIIKRDLQPFRTMLDHPSWWLTVIMVGIGAPLAEEILFRGFLFSALAASPVGVIGASLLTSAGWALLHSYSIVGLTQVFVIGLVFAAILVRTNSLRVTIFCHALYNSILVTLLILYPGP
jgi:uncharacterized protein